VCGRPRCLHGRPFFDIAGGRARTIGNGCLRRDIARLDYYVPMIRGLARQVAVGDVHRLYIRTDICEGAADVPFGRNQKPCRDAFTTDEQTVLATRLRSFAEVVRFVHREEAAVSRRGDGVIVWVGPADLRHGDVFIGGGALTGGSGQGGTYVLKSRDDGWVFGETPSGSFWIT
jgi:hypothetical protein